jgi:hypothetical protein
MEEKRLRCKKPRLTAVGIHCGNHAKSFSSKIGTNFAKKQRQTGRNKSLAN